MNHSFCLIGIFIVTLFCSQQLHSTSWVQTDDLSVPGQTATNSNVAVDINGNAVAVWKRFNGTNQIIQGAKLQCGETTWVPTNDLSLPGQNATLPKVACDQNGNAVAVWQRFDGSVNVIQGATLAASSSVWIPTNDLSLPGVDNIKPIVKVDPNGNAIALWKRKIDPITHVLQGATLLFGNTTWTPTNDLATLGDNLSFHAAVDNNGNAVAVWIRDNGTYLVLEGATLPFGSTTWNPTTVLSTPGENADDPGVAVDSNGKAFAVWQESIGTNDVIKGAILPFGSSTWNPTSDLSTPVPIARNAEVGVDLVGSAFAVWDSKDGSMFVIKGAVLPMGDTTWIPTNDLSASIDNSVVPEIAVSANGCIVAVWRQSPIDTIQGAVIINAPEEPPPNNPLSTSPLPPSNFTGSSIANTFLVQVDHVHSLSWSKSPDPSVIRYKLRAQGRLVATISSNEPLTATFHNQLAGVPITYSLVAVDSFDRESTPLTVTVTSQ